MEVGKRTISEIFNEGRTLEIPFFQRSYVWKIEDWDRFMNDMLMVSKSNKDYFMGSLILKSQPVSSGEEIGDRRLVIDGQQRLTTIILFFKIICPLNQNADLFTDTFFNRSKEIILRHNHNDYKIFEAIVNDKLDEALKVKYKNNNVLNCYNYFTKQENLKEINLDNILDRLYFVGIDLGLEEDEQQIFDTINSLGVSLTAAELLKNELFKRGDEGFYKTTWEKTFEEDEDIKDYWDRNVSSGRKLRTNIDLFLQSHLLIISKSDTNYLRLSSLFNNYKSFLNNKFPDKNEFIHTLIEYARFYKDNIDSDLLNQDIKIDSQIERLNLVIFGLDVTTIIPYFLYLLKEVKNSEERSRMLGLLECYLIRRVICKETTKNYNNFFASFIRNEVNSYEKLSKKIFEADDPTNKLPTDESLKKAFIESDITNQKAKVILYLIEKSKRDTEKYSTNLRPLNEYSLEHVMPKKWKDNWRIPDSSNEKDSERDQLLLTLGNLTIITASLNKSIKNASWEIKKDGKDGKKGLKEYSAGISIFDKYLSDPDWNEDRIKERGNELFKDSKKIWKYDQN